MGLARRDDSPVAKIRSFGIGVEVVILRVVSVGGVNMCAVIRRRHIFGHVLEIVEEDSIDSLYSYVGCSRCHDIRFGDPFWRAR